MSKKAVQVLTIISFVLLICAAIFVLYLPLPDAEIKNAEKKTGQIRFEVISEPTPTESEPPISGTSETTTAEIKIDSNLLRKVDFDELQAINPDAQRWVYIPDTIVDYYVMQEQTVGEGFYLTHDIYKAHYAPGCILTMKVPMNLEDVHLILYGHHMKNHDIAFGQLRDDYVTKEMADEHPYIYVYYKDRSEKWLVWTAVDGDQSDIVYETPLDRGSDRYQDALDDISSKALYQQVAAPDKWSKTLVLSTCRGKVAGSSERFYVVAVLESTYYYQTGKEVKGDYSDET